jgi:hypothetical protein
VCVYVCGAAFVITIVLVVACGIHFSRYGCLILTTFVLVEYYVLRLYFVYNNILFVSTELIKAHCDIYANASTLMGVKGKKQISSHIVRTIQRDGGRFLKWQTTHKNDIKPKQKKKQRGTAVVRKDTKADTLPSQQTVALSSLSISVASSASNWVVVLDEVARIKVSQALKYRYRRQFIDSTIAAVTSDATFLAASTCADAVASTSSSTITPIHTLRIQEISKLLPCLTSTPVKDVNRSKSSASTVSSCSNSSLMLEPVVASDKNSPHSSPLSPLGCSGHTNKLTAATTAPTPITTNAAIVTPVHSKELFHISDHDYLPPHILLDAVSLTPLRVGSSDQESTAAPAISIVQNHRNHFMDIVPTSSGSMSSSSSSSSCSSSTGHHHVDTSIPYKWDCCSIHDDDISISSLGDDALVAAPMRASGSNWIPHAQQRHLLPPPPPLTSYQTPTRRRETGSKNIQQSSQFLLKHSSTSGAYPRPGQDLHSFLNQVLSIGYFADEENDHVIDDDDDEDNMMLTTIVNDETQDITVSTVSQDNFTAV